jgi:hypothetical protein
MQVENVEGVGKTRMWRLKKWPTTVTVCKKRSPQHDISQKKVSCSKLLRVLIKRN